MTALDLFVVALKKDDKLFYFRKNVGKSDGPNGNFDSDIRKARTYGTKHAATSTIKHPDSYCKGGPYPLVVLRLNLQPGDVVYEHEPCN